MLNCKIKFKDKEFTVEEFKSFVLENGLGALSNEAPTKLAKILTEKYNLLSKDESISELWARLNLQRDGK
jgi:hypothetical protein